MAITAFFKKHLGAGAIIILTGAATIGATLAYGSIHFLGPFPSLGHQYQAPYPQRDEPLQWVRPEYEGLSRQLIELGRHEGVFRSSAQITQLACRGVDVDSAVTLGMLTQATLPHGWLSQPGMDIPFQVRHAQHMIDAFLEEESQVRTMLLTRHDSVLGCQLDDSWSRPLDEEASQWLAAQIGVDEEDEQARRRLLTAATHAGLAQLVLSPGLMDKASMERVADLIDKAGQRLAVATGSTPQGLLGLNGRVAMTMLSTDPTQEEAGRARTRKGNLAVIDVFVEDHLEVIIHEWFHSLDLGVAPIIFGYGYPGQSWFDQNTRLDWSVQHPRIHRVMQRPLEAYGKLRQWQTAQKRQDNLKYWTNKSETMAYAFEHWARQDLHELPCHDGGERIGGRPSVNEAACIAQEFIPVWKEVLPQLGLLNEN